MPVLTKYVVPGNRVDLMPAKGSVDENGVKKQYRTKVYDITSDDEIKINMPMEGSKLVLLTVGSEYDMCFYTDAGLYQCFATVKERYKSNNVFVVTMELTSGLRRFQRREYYRLNCILDMKCTEVNNEQIMKFDNNVEFENADFTVEEGTIVDISGGGVRFVSTANYKKGTNIMFSFSLRIGENMVDFKSIGQIIESAEIPNRPDQYQNRVKFVELASDDRESIIKYIFEEERKIRRREKG